MLKWIGATMATYPSIAIGYKEKNRQIQSIYLFI